MIDLDPTIDGSLWIDQYAGDGDVEEEEVQDYLVDLYADTDDPLIANAFAWEMAYRYDFASHLLDRSPPPSLMSATTWIPVRDGDPRASALFDRHYSAKKNRTSPLFVGPGYKMVLITPTANALFVWRLERFRSDNHRGACCAVFRNESNVPGSLLIREAEAWLTWAYPLISYLFTFVDPSALPRGKRPGYVFECAGYTRQEKRTSKQELIVLSKRLRWPLEQFMEN